MLSDIFAVLCVVFVLIAGGYGLVEFFKSAIRDDGVDVTDEWHKK